MGSGKGKSRRVTAGTVISIDAVAFDRACYEAVDDLIASGSPSSTAELIPGLKETTVRTWSMPGNIFRMGVLESIYQAITDHPNDDAAFSTALRPILKSWKSIHSQIDKQLPESTSIGADGQVLELV